MISGYFFGVAGVVFIGIWIFGEGAAPFVIGALSITVAPMPPAPRVATIESAMDVSMNTIAEMVVTLESSDAEPRGPKAVCEPMPPNAPARSAALPLCSNTTIIRKRHTITCTVVNIIPITTDEYSKGPQASRSARSTCARPATNCS